MAGAIPLFTLHAFLGLGVTKANLDRVEIGMTLEKVCDIFGCRPTVNAPIGPEVRGYCWDGIWGMVVLAIDDTEGVLSYPKFFDDDVSLNLRFRRKMGWRD